MGTGIRHNVKHRDRERSEKQRGVCVRSKAGMQCAVKVRKVRARSEAKCLPARTCMVKRKRGLLQSCHGCIVRTEMPCLALLSVCPVSCNALSQMHVCCHLFYRQCCHSEHVREHVCHVSQNQTQLMSCLNPVRLSCLSPVRAMAKCCLPLSFSFLPANV